MNLSELRVEDLPSIWVGTNQSSWGLERRKMRKSDYVNLSAGAGHSLPLLSLDTHSRLPSIWTSGPDPWVLRPSASDLELEHPLFWF